MGVGFYVRDGIPFFFILDFSNTSPITESLWFTLEMDDRSIAVRVIYRPASTDIFCLFEYIEDSLSDITFDFSLINSSTWVMPNLIF